MEFRNKPSAQDQMSELKNHGTSRLGKNYEMCLYWDGYEEYYTKLNESKGEVFRMITLLSGKVKR